MSHLQLHCTIEKEKNTGIKSGGGGHRGRGWDHGGGWLYNVNPQPSQIIEKEIKTKKKNQIKIKFKKIVCP